MFPWFRHTGLIPSHADTLSTFEKRDCRRVGGRVKGDEGEEDSSRDGDNQGGWQRSVPDRSCWKKAASYGQHVNASQDKTQNLEGTTPGRSQCLAFVSTWRALQSQLQMSHSALCWPQLTVGRLPRVNGPRRERRRSTFDAIYFNISVPRCKVCTEFILHSGQGSFFSTTVNG